MSQAEMFGVVANVEQYLFLAAILVFWAKMLIRFSHIFVIPIRDLFFFSRRKLKNVTNDEKGALTKYNFVTVIVDKNNTHVE